LTAGAGQIKSAVDLINRPVSGTLFVVILLVIGFIIWTSIKNRRTNFQT
jgi:putative tricarboxylic transport membrane protein